MTGVVTGEGLALVVNAGSSSLKAALLDGTGRQVWRDQRAWTPPADPTADASSERTGDATHGEALEAVLDGWLPSALAPWRGEMTFAAHRVVHGGERFTAPTRLNPQVLAQIDRLVPLAPLHNPPALRAIRWMERWAPGLEQWACFDTAFHATIPVEAHTYAVPAEWRQQGLRRYGFHGLNHQHVSEVVSRRRVGDGGPLSGGPQPLRLISCHLGAGCSLCAVEGGRSIATTMGFTPLEGLVMATRSGSVDPGLLLYQLRAGLSPRDIDDTLNGGSGLLGLSELSSSMEDLRSAAQDGHQGAQLAIAVFRQRLLEAIGAMAATLRGVDVIALTGGIGEHDGTLRAELQDSLSWLQPFELLRVPADEEGLIARSCRAVRCAVPRT